jgi:hypothetical protein
LEGSMRFLKILTVVVVLAVVVKAGLYYVIPSLRPLPALAVNIKSGDELARQVLQKFPLGSPATALKAELEKEGGWSPVIKDNINNNGEQFVVFKSAGWPLGHRGHDDHMEIRCG